MNDRPSYRRSILQAATLIAVAYALVWVGELQPLNLFAAGVATVTAFAILLGANLNR